MKKPSEYRGDYERKKQMEEEEQGRTPVARANFGVGCRGCGHAAEKHTYSQKRQRFRCSVCGCELYH